MSQQVESPSWSRTTRLIVGLIALAILLLLMWRFQALVGQIVVGLPLHMNGRAGPEAEAARAFGEKVRARANVPVDYLDERWTSLEAERALDEGGVRKKDRRGRVDPIAAALLLRTWLSRRKS